MTDSTPKDEEISTLDIRYHGWRNATGVNWQHLFGSRAVGLPGVTTSVASVGQTVKDLVREGVPPAGTPADQVIDSSPVIFQTDSTESETTVKYDATLSASSKRKFQFGASVKQFRLRYETAAPLGFDSPYSVQPGVNPFSIDDRFTAWQSSAYVQVTQDLTSALKVTAGGRFDRYQYINASRFSPRVAASLALTSRLAVKASTGLYYQQPAFQSASTRASTGTRRSRGNRSSCFSESRI